MKQQGFYQFCFLVYYTVEKMPFQLPHALGEGSTQDAWSGKHHDHFFMELHVLTTAPVKNINSFHTYFCSTTWYIMTV